MKVKASTPSRGYVHIDTFIGTARVLYSMSEIQVAGFRAFMTGRHYQKNEEDFLPDLEKYLGKGD